MNTKLVILLALVNLVFAQYGPNEFDGGALPPSGDEGEYAAAQPDFDGENAEVPFESNQEGAFEGGEYGPQGGMMPQGMIQNEQLQGQGPYGAPGGYAPDETQMRPKFFKK